MNPYPNSGDPNQPTQYPPNQEQAGTPYGGGYQPPPTEYGDQPLYQPGAYHQSSYQSPYEQTPYAQSSSIVFDWRYLTAGIGALVSLIAFFLPYSGANGYGGYVSAGSGFQRGHQLLLDFIIALAALAIAALLQFRSQIPTASIPPAIQKLINLLNQHTSGLTLVGLGIFGFFFRFVLDLGSLSSWGIGSWLYTLGIIAVAIGGFFVWRPPASISTQVPPTR